MQLKLLMVLNTYMAEMLVCLFLVMAKSRVLFLQFRWHVETGAWHNSSSSFKYWCRTGGLRTIMRKTLRMSLK